MNKLSIKLGLLYGGISVFLSLIFYFLGVEIMSSWWVGIIIMLFLLTVIIVLSLRYRKAIGGYITFKEAFAAVVTICVVGGAISTIYQMLLYNVIDPGYPERLNTAVMQNTMMFMESMGAPEEQIDEMMENMEDTADRFSTMALVQSYFMGILMSALLALVIAAFIKKQKNEFVSDINPE